MRKLFLLSIAFIFLYYVTSYACIYTAFVMHNVLSPFNPEYRSKEMIGTEYRHFYVNVGGHDLFLNPLREYSEEHKTYTSNEKYISRISNWGCLYVPVFDVFIDDRIGDMNENCL